LFCRRWFVLYIKIYTLIENHYNKTLLLLEAPSTFMGIAWSIKLFATYTARGFFDSNLLLQFTFFSIWIFTVHVFFIKSTNTWLSLSLEPKLFMTIAINNPIPIPLKRIISHGSPETDSHFAINTAADEFT